MITFAKVLILVQMCLCVHVSPQHSRRLIGYRNASIRASDPLGQQGGVSRGVLPNPPFLSNPQYQPNINMERMARFANFQRALPMLPRRKQLHRRFNVFQSATQRRIESRPNLPRVFTRQRFRQLGRGRLNLREGESILNRRRTTNIRPVINHNRPIRPQPIIVPHTHRMNTAEQPNRSPVKPNVNFHDGSIINADFQTTTPLNAPNVNRQTNSLLALLNSRRPKTRSLNDEIALRFHLVKLNAIKSDNTDTDKMLQMQIDYIETISETAIRREVLKLLVKDIVEKSGVMGNDPSSSNLKALVSVQDMISKITNHFNTSVSVSNIILPIAESTTIKPDIVTAFNERTSENVNTNAKDQTALRKRIETALSVFIHAGFRRNRTRAGLDAVMRNRNITNQFHSNRNAKHTKNDHRPSVGMPAFGPKIENAFGTTGRPTAVPETTTMDHRKRERIGGNNTYWSHLSSAITNMLCNYCQQLRNDTCIRTYCANTVSTGSTTTTAT